MFVRFQERNGRLLVRLAASRRINGKVRQEHIADLGVVAIDLSPEARIAFWTKLHQNLSRLANRVPDPTKILAAVHARVPMPSPADKASANAAGNQRSLRVWTSHAENCREQIEMREAMKAQIEREIECLRSEATRAEANTKAAQDAIQIGQEAPKPLSARQLAELYSVLGLTKQTRHRWRKRAELSEDKFQALLDRKFQPRRDGKGRFA